MTEQLTSREVPSTYLERLELANYRCFVHLAVPMHPELTVLIARNGAGKTSVMDAIAIAFGTFVGSFLAGTGIGANQRDVRVRLTNPALREMEPQFPLSITAVGTVNGLHIEWSRKVNSSKSGTTIKDAKPLTLISEGLQRAVTDNSRLCCLCSLTTARGGCGSRRR